MPEPYEQPAIPEGISPDARETWPSADLIADFLGDQIARLDDLDFEIRPGDEVAVHDDPGAQAAARRFRDVVGCFASGITVITAMSPDGPVGMTCQSFASVSLDPPLVTFIPARTSRAWPLIQRSGRFCVNILAADQEHVSAQMATKGIDKFAGLDWEPAAVTGSPVIAGTLAHLDCTIHAVHEGGDHFVVLGRVEHLEQHADDAATTEPLLYFKGRYRTTDER
ncbi:flavin reductase family protein [Nocardioides sp.]|uniref:flavin reductase family protein n=1 Tax=Nocardioides sp. TaxID=35761 RepID=UPI0035134125